MGSAERGLRTLALTAGYRTLRSLANAAGIDRHTLGEAMHGKAATRRAVVARLASALHVDAELLRRLFETAREERASRAQRSAGT